MDSLGMRMALGDIGISILEAIKDVPMCIQDLSFLTGIPEECINPRISFLEMMGFTTYRDDILELTPNGKSKLATLSMSQHGW
ncbi:hypothetical protein GF325_14155 [Candidatus Bathyarchaeota archaeon]|nr:hypothetical protein [Candidatus Bathyarchaeota archaeon]